MQHTIEHIETLNINVTLGAAARAPSDGFLEALLKIKPITPRAAASGTPPAIGSVWTGAGGIYGGLVRGEDGAPDAHIVVSTIKPPGDLSWQAALDWAKTVQEDGHRDFALPTRFQAAILYGNLRDHFEQSGWHWTSSECSERTAWSQTFSSGSQDYYGKSNEARARAVRLIPLAA